VSGPRSLQRLEAHDVTCVLGDGAGDAVLGLQVTFAHQCHVNGVCPQPGAVDRVLHLGHGIGISGPCGSDLDHGSIILLRSGGMSTGRSRRPHTGGTRWSRMPTRTTTAMVAMAP